MVVQGAILGALIALVALTVKWALTDDGQEAEDDERAKDLEFNPWAPSNIIWTHCNARTGEKLNKWIGDGIEIVAEPELMEPPIYVDKGARIEYTEGLYSNLYIYNLDSAIRISVKDDRFKANDIEALIAFLVEEKIIITDGI